MSMSKFGNFLKRAAKGWFSPYALISALFNKEPYGEGGYLDSFLNKKTGAGLTGAEIEQNAWNSEEAEKQRAWTEQMDNTKYQRMTTDMAAAGLNPAMVYGQSVGASAPSGASASGASNSGDATLVSGLLDIIFAKERLQGIKDENALKRANAQAAIMNAWSNFRNAGSQERQASVSETRVGIEKMLADKHVEVDDATINKFAEDALYVKELRQFVSKNYDLMKQNADSLAKQALAAMRQADAAIQNAATESYKADYSTDLMYEQTLLQSILNGEHKILYNALPERTKTEIENLKKQGVILDKQGRLIDKQGNLATALQVKAYVSCATDVAKTVASFIPGANVGGSVVGDSGQPEFYTGLGTSY